MDRSDIDAIVLWCRDRVPSDQWHFRHVEAFVTGRHIDVVAVQVRTDGHESRTPVARLRLMNSGLWTLYWRDSDGSFQPYRHFPSDARVREILDFLAADPDPLFWP